MKGRKFEIVSCVLSILKQVVKQDLYVSNNQQKNNKKLMKKQEHKPKKNKIQNYNKQVKNNVR